MERDGEENANNIATVRAATKDDYDSLRTVFDQAEAFHREALPHIFRRPAGAFPPRSLYDSMVSDARSTVFVAADGDDLVGFVTVREGDTPDDPIFVPRRLAIVDMLAVQRDRQRRGIGRALMEAVHQWARHRDLDEIELNVWEFNTRAIAFYKELGYETASRLMTRKV